MSTLMLSYIINLGVGCIFLGVILAMISHLKKHPDHPYHDSILEKVNTFQESGDMVILALIVIFTHFWIILVGWALYIDRFEND